MNKVISKIPKMDFLRLALSIFLIVGIIFPVIAMMFQVESSDIGKIFSDPTFYNMLANSIISTITASLISVFLALICAYLLNKSNVKNKNTFIVLLTIPMLIPSISHALGLINLFGENGFIDKIFGIGVDIYGFTGIVLGSIMYSFPVAFLLIYDALKYEDKSIYDAAETLGIPKLRAFFALTLPYLKKVLISAFFAVFTMIFTDYGVPLAIGGKYSTLPVFLYQEVINQMNFSTGAIIGVIILFPAVIAFVYDLFTKDQAVEEKKRSIIKPSKAFNICSYIVLIIVIFIIILPQIAFAITSFVKSFPNDMSLSLVHIKYALKAGMGIYYLNSLLIAFLSGLCGTIIAYMTAYLSTRIEGKIGKILHFISTTSLAIPGMVLGIGFIFLFRRTPLYATIIVLILANVIHFFASPYIMARNAFNKLNKNYETVGKALGITRFRIFKDVLIPNTTDTLIEMFSYFFVNSMITISAVAFLYSIFNMPLALLIPQFERQLSYEAAAIVSLLILFTNIIFKLLINRIQSYIKNRIKKENHNMNLNKYQFELLSYLERKGKGEYTQRKIADDITISLGIVNKILNQYLSEGLVAYDKKQLYITEKGLDALEPYRVKRAIIIAAGFGSRLVPVTINTPKPLVEVNGKRIIETLLDSLVAAEITDIYLVRGYKKEQFDILLEKYPFIKFIDNDIYNLSNNISSIYAAKDYINNTYICEADLFINNPTLIRKYQFSTNYLGAYVQETDDWCFHKTNGYISKVAIGGENCYHMVGISYWNSEDSIKLAKRIDDVFHSRGGKENYWDNVPLKIHKKDFKIEIRECKKKDVVEIDTFDELKAFDPTYNNYESNF